MQEPSERKRFKFFSVPGVTFVLREDGWYYADSSSARVSRRGEEPPPLTEHGPFLGPEAAASAFAERLGPLFQGMQFAPLDPQSPIALDADLRALAEALEARLGGAPL